MDMHVKDCTLQLELRIEWIFITLRLFSDALIYGLVPKHGKYLFGICSSLRNIFPVNSL